MQISCVTCEIKFALNMALSKIIAYSQYIALYILSMNKQIYNLMLTIEEKYLEGVWVSNKAHIFLYNPFL